MVAPILSARIGGPLRLAAGLLLCLSLFTPGGARAQEVVERSFAIALIRDTLAAVDHGNRSGNYTVLRDLASPDLAARADATGLAARLADLRRAGVDLLQATVADPVILSAQVADAQGQMRLTGYVPLQPQHVSFDLVFQIEGARWRLVDFSIGTFAAIEPTPPLPEPQAPEPQAPEQQPAAIEASPDPEEDAAE